MTVLAERVATLMESATDGGARVVGADSTWTVLDLVRHMSLLPEVYTAASHEGPLAMSPSAEAMAATNAKTLTMADDRTLEDIPGIFRTQVTVLLEHLQDSDPDAAMQFHGHITLTPGELGGIAIGEWLVHGWELAKTVGAPWAVDPAHACLVIAAMNAVLPTWLDAEAAAGHSGRYEYRLRGTGRRVQWTFTDGALATRPPEGTRFRPDTIVWAEPSALLLYNYQRTGVWSNAVRGALIAGGRRPLRALTVRRLFHPA